MKIMVAMSGGVDSSVVAHLLKNQGHEVIGVMMKLWTDPLAPAMRRQLPKKCCSIEHIQRARSVCADLNVPFYVTNFEDAFKTEVVDPFLEAYENGETPNPCIDCNRLIKMGALLKMAEELGCEKMATGHYARIEEDAEGFHLKQAVDASRDQSYYLYTLTQEKMAKVLFPLGGMLKSDVFVLADKYGVSIPDYYHESEDLCFYPEKEPEPFLRRHLKTIEEGDIVTKDGTKVGTHKGLPFYTLGQRKGLGIGGLKIPLHVTEKRKETNTIVVAPAGEDMTTEARTLNVSWTGTPPKQSEWHTASARANSLGEMISVRYRWDGEAVTCTFAKPVRGVAPGQSIVLYRDDEVLGGGTVVSKSQKP